MISFLQRFRRTEAASTDKRNCAQTMRAEERSLISKVIWEWPEGQPVRVERAVADFPELRNSPRALVELAIEEFNDRREEGEDISASDFAERFPEIRSQLLDSLVFEKALKEMSGWFQSVLSPRDDTMNWPAVGDQIAGFLLVEPLGRGGFSRVFVARELGYENRKVAVKICRQDTHEARTLATLTHSGIGAVHYVRQVPESGLTVICMPLTSRSTLNDVIRRSAVRGYRPLSADVVWDEVRSRNSIDSATPAWAGASFASWARSLMSNLAEALAASHAQNIVHCDLKPTNVLVTAEGKPTLVDFNVAFRRNAVASPANVGGTLPYMAPEQIRAFAGEGFSTIGPHTDIYGLAATIYELLTGDLPFGAAPPADDGVQMLLERRQRQPKSIRETNPQVSPEFDELILECLSYETGARPQTAGELIARLERVGQGTDETVRPRARLSTFTTVAAVVVLLAAVGSLPFERGQDSTDLASASLVVVPATPQVLTPEEKLHGILANGYDAFEDADYHAAEKFFLAAIRFDPGHEGAVLGYIRSSFKLGNVEAAERTALQIHNDGTPEKAALHGLCYAGTNNHKMAVTAFRTAIDGGLETRQVLTDLGYSLSACGQYQDAVDVLERVRRMGGDTSIANLILVRAYPMLWQQREKGKPIYDFDEQLLIKLIEDSGDSRARSFTAAQVYALLAGMFGREDPDIKDEWAQRSLSEFSHGCELGLDLAYWNGIKHAMSDSVLKSQEAKKFAGVPGDRFPAQHKTFFLLDPIVGTRLERCVDKKLAAKIAVEPEGLVAASR
ncbi:MAG: protein kinase [Planctomycetota bacterium]|nr:protein kinase [Planctomycetota bacterium]